MIALSIDHHFLHSLADIFTHLVQLLFHCIHQEEMDKENT